MSIKNSDMPAMPQSVQFGKEYHKDFDGNGLTKREQFCLTMGVADTGDEELDAIITKGNTQKLVAMVMQAMISSKYYSVFCGRYDNKEDGVAIAAVEHVDALLAQLEEKSDE